MDEVSIYFDNKKEEKNNKNKDEKKEMSDWTSGNSWNGEKETDKNTVYKKFTDTSSKYDSSKYNSSNNRNGKWNNSAKNNGKNKWKSRSNGKNNTKKSNERPLASSTDTGGGWKPRQIDTSTDEGKKEMYVKTAKGCLNKMTNLTFDKLSDQYLEIALKEDELVGLLKLLIDQIFQQALLQPTFCELYSNLCFKIYSNDTLKTNFTRTLLKKCQEEFEKDNQGPPEDLDPEEILEYEFKAKRRTLSNIKFIGELYKNKMLVVPVIHVCIKKLLNQNLDEPDEEKLESLCKLFGNVGKEIDNEKSSKIINGYFSQLENLKTKVSPRIRFMIEDTIDLRNQGW